MNVASVRAALQTTAQAVTTTAYSFPTSGVVLGVEHYLPSEDQWNSLASGRAKMFIQPVTFQVQAQTNIGFGNVPATLYFNLTKFTDTTLVNEEEFAASVAKAWLDASYVTNVSMGEWRYLPMDAGKKVICHVTFTVQVMLCL